MGLFDLLRESVTVKIETDRPEQTLNMLAERGVKIEKIRRDGKNSVRAVMTGGGYAELKRAEREKGGFTADRIKARGAAVYTHRVKKRYILLAGAIACFLAVQVSDLFIWQIDVSGNETVPTAEILTALKREGVGIGTCRVTVDEVMLANSMLIAVPELSWFTMNTHGSRAEVLVREERRAPEMAEDACGDVTAKKAGIITKITVINGERKVSVGDEVKAGDVLVSGTVGSISSGTRTLRAAAEVEARTHYEMTAAMPLQTYRKTYTGREKTKTAVILGGKRINLYFSGGNSWGSCDKITKSNTLTLPNGAVLPLTVVKTCAAEYYMNCAEKTPDAAASILKARLVERLQGEIGDGGIISTDFLQSEADGVMTVTLIAECVEQIGGQSPAATNDIAGGGTG